MGKQHLDTLSVAAGLFEGLCAGERAGNIAGNTASVRLGARRASRPALKLTFHDLRGTAVTRLALAGSTEAEIAVFTGHSLNDVRDILTRHYLSHDPALADSAVTKLENWSKGEQKLLTALPTGTVELRRKTRKAE